MLLNIMLLKVTALVVHIAAMIDQGQALKCSPSDKRKIYPACAMDYRYMVLWCDQTNLTEVPDPALIYSIAPCSKANTLYFNDSCLTNLKAETFIKYQRLEVISLSNNLITNISNRTFCNQSKLKELDLSSNRISKLELYSFAGLHNLNLLSLNDNRIATLNLHWFVQLKSLRELSVCDNKISKWIRPHTHWQFHFLKKLYLDGNRLKHLEPHNFLHMRGLQKLSLRNNRLTTIKEKTFDATISITSLDLRDNLLEVLPKNLFLKLCDLRELFLDGNKLVTPRPHWAVNILRNSQIFMTSYTFSNNDWNCDCDSVKYWRLMQALLSTNDVTEKMLGYSLDLKCSSPRSLSGKTLLNLTMAEILANKQCLEVATSVHSKDQQLQPLAVQIEDYKSDECSVRNLQFTSEIDVIKPYFTTKKTNYFDNDTVIFLILTGIGLFGTINFVFFIWCKRKKIKNNSNPNKRMKCVVVLP